MENIQYSPADGFPYYFNLVKDQGVEALFTSPSTLKFLKSIDEEKAAYRYSTRQVEY